MVNIHENLERFRDYFVKRKEFEKVDQCNTIMTELDEHFFLNTQEVEALHKYFMTCGYISYEHHEEVHKICDRLFAFYDATLIRVGKEN